MSKRNVIVAALGVAALLVAGGLMASNMGFKLNYVLSGPGSSASGTNTLGLPFNQQVGLNDAKDLIDDVNATSPGSIVNVQQFNKATDAFVLYDGTTGTPFALNTSEGYFVKVNTDVNYIVVGSHDPGFTVNFAGPGSSASGTNFYSVPYHTTDADAKGLIDEINGASPGSVVNVQQFNKGTDAFVLYDGTTGSPFALTPGQAYFVKVNTDVSLVPSHY